MRIIIPTFKQPTEPERISGNIKKKLNNKGLWDINPVNLFRITWKNNFQTGLYGEVNYFEVPEVITGVKARIIGLVGKFFPTGSHKVRAEFGCLVPRLVSGEFNPYIHKAVWTSTGNYCRGGAFDCALPGCTAVAILPEEMSNERFEWLRKIGAEVIATPGCESNVKEIYDKCNELRKDENYIIFNQFDEFGNPIYHYQITLISIEEVNEKVKTESSRFSAYVSATGSAGTIAAGDYVKKLFPNMIITASEALQCPTIFMNGFGGHKIEDIGDKNIPFVHNVRNTDMITAIDNEDCIRIMRLFNEEEGLKFLNEVCINEKTSAKLNLIGISGIANLLAVIKIAKYFEFNEKDTIFTIFTGSMELYKSRIDEYRIKNGKYKKISSVRDFDSFLPNQKTDYKKELTYYESKSGHNLKYYTCIEQQGIEAGEPNAQWDEEYWEDIFENKVKEFDKLIEEFNVI